MSAPATNTNHQSEQDNLIEQWFKLDTNLLTQAVDILANHYTDTNINHNNRSVPTWNITTLPTHGTMTTKVIQSLLPYIVQGATKLYDPTYAVSMDCPVINVAHAINICSVYMNQNMLHAATSPVATEAESTVIRWLCTLCDNIFDGGQMTVGATVATLTALWVARDYRKCTRVIGSSMSHLSIEKCARLLGMKYISIECDGVHRMKLKDVQKLGDLSDAALVCTAGTTISGAIDEMLDVKQLGAGWIHCDGAWGGSLQFSTQYKHRLLGLQHCDSFCISAHKLLMQPKGTAVVLFRSWNTVKPVISFGGAYLTHANVGVLGSKNAMGEALMGTLITVGQIGLASIVDRCIEICDNLYQLMKADHRFILFAPPETGCLLWRIQESSNNKNTEQIVAEMVRLKLCTSAMLDNVLWCRNVSCNPVAKSDKIFKRIVEVAFPK